MNLLEEAQQAMLHLASLTSRLREGSTPDLYAILACQSDLVRLHMQLGVEMSRKFSSKESSYLARKIKQANSYLSNRMPIDGKTRVTAADATENAFITVQAEYEAEIAAMAEYELFRALMKSLQNAMDYARTVVSFLKSAESSPST